MIEDISLELRYLSLSLVILTALLLSKLRTHRKKSGSKQIIVPYIPFSHYEIGKAFVELRIHKLLLEAFEEVGPYFQLRGPNKSIIVADIDIIKDVLSDREVLKPAKLYSMFRFIHGGDNDILTSEGKFHRLSRKNMSHAFSSNHIRRMREVSLRHTDSFVHNQLEKYRDSGKSFDISEEMLSLTFDVIMEAAFQYKMPSDEKEKFLEEVDIVLKECYKENFPLRRTKLNFLIPSVRRAKKAQSFMRKVAMNIIQSYKSLDSKLNGTVIDKIMSNTEAYTNDEERVADVLILIIAGHETTAFSLAWILIELSKDSELQIQLRQELKKENSLQELSKNKVLASIIKESLRLHPVAATGSSRVSRKDYILDDGQCFIPKGSNLVFAPAIYFMNSKYFEDPYKFKPSRWYENPSKKSEEAFLPFVIGRRNCIGQSLAVAQLFSVVPHIIKKFHLKIEIEGTEEFYLTLKPKGWRLTAEHPPSD